MEWADEGGSSPAPSLGGGLTTLQTLLPHHSPRTQAQTSNSHLLHSPLIMSAASWMMTSLGTSQMRQTHKDLKIDEIVHVKHNVVCSEGMYCVETL